jgi:hypothetical protein
MPFCDGCGAQADDEHIRRRIEGLELATRFRPIHIQILFLDAVPPARPEDYFYRAARDRSVRSLASRMFFDELAKCAELSAGTEIQEGSAIAEFQRRGFFLAYAVECPLSNPRDLGDVLRRLAPSILQRIQTSYKPKYIAPLGHPIQELIPLFQLKGLVHQLLLDDGGPFVDPFLGDPQNQAEFGTALGDRLLRALASLSRSS